MNERSPISEESDSAAGRQVISRAAAVLRILAEDNSGQSLGQIAKRADLPRTTVHRIVAALEAQQLAAITPQGIKLGQALVSLAASAHVDVVSAARPFVESLGRKLRETVDLCVFRGLHAVSVDQFASDQELRVVSAVGTAYPIHCTAHGKALLSLHSDSQLKSLLDSKLEKRTPGTITSRAKLLEQLQLVRKQGWALDEEEHAVGVCGVGVPIVTGGSELYAMSIAVPAVRFHGQREHYLSALFQCKAEVEAVLAG